MLTTEIFPVLRSGWKRSFASLTDRDGRDENVDSKCLRRSSKASSPNERRHVRVYHILIIWTYLLNISRRFIFSQFHTKQCEDYSSPEEGEAIDDDEDDDDENGNEEVEGGARHSETGNGMLRQSALLPTPSRWVEWPPRSLFSLSLLQRTVFTVIESSAFLNWFVDLQSDYLDGSDFRLEGKINHSRGRRGQQPCAVL